MTIVDKIKDSNILDSNNEFRIEEAIYKKISKKLIISAVLKYAVSLNDYKELKRIMHEMVKSIGVDVDLKVNIGYEDETLTTDELKEYLVEILNYLSDKSVSFRSLNVDECVIDDNKISFKVACDAKGVDELMAPIKTMFEKYGFQIETNVVVDESKSLSEAINELDNKLMAELERQQQEAHEAQRFNKMIQESKKNYKKYIPESVTPIKGIPATHEELQAYINEAGSDTFLFEGYVFDKEIKTTKNKNTDKCWVKASSLPYFDLTSMTLER